jgi:hypothetical protein
MVTQTSRFNRWQNISGMRGHSIICCLYMYVVVVQLPATVATSCASDADCILCGGYCLLDDMTCMCPPSYCGSCAYDASDQSTKLWSRCKCSDGEYCGKGNSSGVCTRFPTPVAVSVYVAYAVFFLIAATQAIPAGSGGEWTPMETRLPS